MDKVTVDKHELILTITENRNKHRALYEKAIEGYQRTAIGRLREKIDKLEAGELPTLHIGLAAPEDHTEDYDTVLAMLDMSRDEEVTISNKDFRSYVLDEWGWKHTFKASTDFYTVESDA